MTYWKQREYDVKQFWKKRGHKAKRLSFHTKQSDGAHADVIVDNLLKIDAKSTHGSDSISIKKKDCEKLDDIYSSIQFYFYGWGKPYTIIPSEEYEKLIKFYQDWSDEK